MSVILANILPFVVLIGVLIGLHEFGHYWAARRLGISVRAFAVGVGPALWSRTSRDGVRWMVGALPLGGYVAFPRTAEEKGSPGALFDETPAWKRFIVYAAGPLANILLFFVVTTGLFAIVGRTEVAPVVTSVVAEGPADRAGIRAGDRIEAIDGLRIRSFTDVTSLISTRTGGTVALELSREGKPFALKVTLGEHVVQGPGGRTFRAALLGVSASELQRVHYGPLEAMRLSLHEGVLSVIGTFRVLGSILTGDRPVTVMSGPVGIAEITGSFVSRLDSFLFFAAGLSLNIAIVNLLPIPPLDGGQMLMLAGEKLAGARVFRLARLLTAMGAIGLLGLTLYLTWHDVLRLLG